MKRLLLFVLFAMMAVGSARAQVLLGNGQVISALSGSAGNQKQYQITVPTGASKLEIKIWGGSGDCDLYVRRGSQPTTSSYDYRPYLGGSTETVTINNPSSGSWFIMLRAYSTYSGVLLSATYTTGSGSVVTLSNGQVLSSRSGVTGSQSHYKISVPSGQSSLQIKIWGGSGDCDLHVKRGSQASTSSYDYRPYASGNNETVTVSNPSSGDWYIMLHAYSAFSGASLSATYAAPAARVATPSFSLAGGTYTSAKSVSILCGTSGATIRYTTNGSEPTSSSSVYPGPIAVNSTTTIKAKAFKSGMTESDTASATYTINIPSRVATPNLSPAGGTFTSPQLVSISCGTSGATIRYTTNGSEPTSASTVYTGPLSVPSTRTIKAKAFKSGMTESFVATAAYTITSPSVQALQNRETVYGQGGAAGSERIFKITVPAGQAKLEIRISPSSWGTSGDCDLYVKRGSRPTSSSYDYRPYLGGNTESVAVSSPAAGDWYIMLRGYSAFTGVNLQARYYITLKNTSFTVPEDAWPQNNTSCTESMVNTFFCSLDLATMHLPAAFGGACYAVSVLELRWYRLHKANPALPRLQSVGAGFPVWLVDYVAMATQDRTIAQNAIAGIVAILGCSTPENTVNAMKTQLAAGNPGLVSMRMNVGNHAVVAVGYEEDDKDVVFFVADSNSTRPSQRAESLIYTKATKSWQAYLPSYLGTAWTVNCVGFTRLADCP